MKENSSKEVSWNLDLRKIDTITEQLEREIQILKEKRILKNKK